MVHPRGVSGRTPAGLLGGQVSRTPALELSSSWESSTEVLGQTRGRPGEGAGRWGTCCRDSDVWAATCPLLPQTTWCVRRSASTPCWPSTASVPPRPRSSPCWCTRPVASECWGRGRGRGQARGGTAQVAARVGCQESPQATEASLSPKTCWQPPKSQTIVFTAFKSCSGDPSGHPPRLSHAGRGPGRPGWPCWPPPIARRGMQDSRGRRQPPGGRRGGWPW